MHTLYTATNTNLKNRFKSPKNAAVQNIFEQMEPTGAVINASTSFDRTNFHCTFSYKFFSKWAKSESMRMQTPPFSEELDANEKKVVSIEQLLPVHPLHTN